MPSGGVHCRWFAFVGFLIRSLPPPFGLGLSLAGGQHHAGYFKNLTSSPWALNPLHTPIAATWQTHLGCVAFTAGGAFWYINEAMKVQSSCDRMYIGRGGDFGGSQLRVLNWPRNFPCEIQGLLQNFSRTSGRYCGLQWGGTVCCMCTVLRVQLVSGPDMCLNFDN